MKNKVSLVKGEGRKKNILKSLALLKSEIKNKVGGKKVIIKPNLLSDQNQLPSTNVESVQAVIEFLSSVGVNDIIVAEFSTHDTTKAYRNLGYDKLGVKLIDLEREDNFKEIKLDGVTIKVSELLLENNFIISLAKPKTHDVVVATLSIKNLLMGSVKNKMDMHQGYKGTNENLSLLANKSQLWPDLAVIDGFTGMEGTGPSHGQEVKSKWSLASLDALAADWVALKCMGIKPQDIGYLYYISRKNFGSYSKQDIKIKGNSIEDCKKQYKLHPRFKKQLEWKNDTN